MKTAPGKYHKNAQALKQILKPKVNLSAHKKKQILNKFYDEAAATDSELYNKIGDKDPGRYASIMSGRYDGNPMPKDYPRKEFHYVDKFGNVESAADRIREKDKIEKDFFLNKLPKKKVIKVAKKPKPKPTYLNGNVIDITPLIDDEWWKIFEDLEEPPKEESRLLLVPKSKAEGITSILNLHNKKFVG